MSELTKVKKPGLRVMAHLTNDEAVAKAQKDHFAAVVKKLERSK